MSQPVALHPLYADGAVVQHSAPLPIRGTATAGVVVHVTLGTASASVTAAADGAWLVWLPPQAPTAAATLTASAADGSTCTAQVAVGEVVLCSGQSNMEWPLSMSTGGEAAMDAPADPLLRAFVVPHRVAMRPMTDSEGYWSTLDERERRAVFGAVPFHAGRALRAADPHLPVGLVLCAWGGTPIEAWLPPSIHNATEQTARQQALAVHASQQNALETARLAAIRDAYEQRFRAWQRAIHAGDGGEAAGFMAADADLRGWETRTVPGHWPDGQWAEHLGAAWFACEVMVPAELAGQPATLLLGEVDNEDRTWLNGVALGGIDQMAGPDHWQMQREHPVPAGVLRAGANRLTVRVVVYAGRGGFGGHPSGMALRVGGRLLRLPGRWRCRRGGGLPGPRPLWPAELMPPVHQHVPGTLFDGMLAPLLPVALGGVWWYQGESNVDRAACYAEQLERLVHSWRRRAAGGAPVPPLPFSVVQLASIKPPTPAADAAAPYAALRAAQAHILDLPAGGLATALDLGEADDIHPRRKEPVGQRLAAVHRRLRGAAVLAAPPRPQGKLQLLGPGSYAVDFDALLQTSDGGPVQGLAVQGDDGCWRWAVARIAGRRLCLAVPGQRLVACRYAWSDNALHANLRGEQAWAVEPFMVRCPAS
jgi:sialate O-acetylesterase